MAGMSRRGLQGPKLQGFFYGFLYSLFFEFIFITKVMDFITPFPRVLCMTVGTDFYFDRI